MKKLNFITLSNEYGGYIAFARQTLNLSFNGIEKKYPGYMYKMDRQLTAVECDQLRQYPNVLVCTLVSEYAPELRRTAVFIADRKFITAN